MIKKLAGTFIAAGALLAFTAPAAHAAPPEPFTITEDIDFEAEEFAFTASDPLCPSGTFEDEVLTAGAGNAPIPKVNLRIRTVYRCDSGDTFFAEACVPGGKRRRVLNEHRTNHLPRWYRRVRRSAVMA